MQPALYLLIALLAAATAYLFARHSALRASLGDSIQRENEARTRAATAEAELKTALHEKGQFQNEAARVQEIKSSLRDRESEIQTLTSRISLLDREKTQALKDAEAANQRAVEMVGLKDEQIARLNEFIAQARSVLTTEFKALSADALKDVSDQLIKTADSLIEKHGQRTTSDVQLHHQQIQTMLKPVEETIKRLDKHVEETGLTRARAEALLNEQVSRLSAASESLSTALRKPVIRGSWGEMTLENALESAGLEANIDFVLQHSTGDADDLRRRTDALINLPKGRKLIIDSKNLMESYFEYANASSDAEKALSAEKHSKSLRGHIKSLSAKEYWKRYPGLDCVILFIPHDGMYHAAIQDEAELIREACEKRVFIANPMSLIPLLKAIRYVLDQERLNESAEEISKVGAELYSEITRFAENLARVGKSLRSTVNAYNDAIPGLERFILAKSRKLKQLGSGKGADPELPDELDLIPRAFSAPELKSLSAGESGA